MVTKKFFALASVTALTGLMAVAMGGAGCSSTTTIDPGAGDTGGGETSKVDVKTPPKDASDTTDSAVDDTCKGKLAVDTTMLPWKPPAQTLGACTQKMLSDLVTYVSTNTGAKYADWKKTVTDPACSACVFAKVADAKWAPLLEDPMGTLVELNVGGCIAIAAKGALGAKADDCGKAYQNWFDCRFEACTDCPNGDQAAFQKCTGLATKGACKAAAANVTTVCGATVVGDAETACNGDKFVFEGPIKAQCIAGVSATDGGDN